ncbi:RNA polymerase II-associated protein RBA50 [Cladobotryum mycophilum]|uniref:RNA polymerase II-associated protein RBA50 n=1 Tax=Cladobotryum mycophilum TaxID=491253 RepID=A0ABR0SVH1_9HYPO
MDPTLLIGDIVEREEIDKKPVEFPSAPVSSTGFPQHKRRWKPSAFKQKRAGNAATESPIPQPSSSGISSQNPGFDEIEKRRIDQENRQKIENMTPQEISQAQEDLLNGLNPDLVQRLLRGNSVAISISIPAVATATPKIQVDDTSEPSPTISQTQPTPPVTNVTSTKKIADDYNEDQAPAQIPPDLFPIVDLPRSTHFPVPPGLPDLDPSDPNFLATLHEKYFPNLPADPSKLAWMAPIPSQDSIADRDSSYYPHPEISISALRFDFRGRFLSPRVSRSIPSSKGLHHHGDAPEAAGYTVAELARLARSAVPAQRCMAFQTLGRILYRLGRGEWGTGVDHPIAMGVWNAMKEGRVLQTLIEATMGEGGHRGSRAYATEALWLFEKGGWREKVKGR